MRMPWVGSGETIKISKENGKKQISFIQITGHSWITHPFTYMPTPEHPKDGYEPAKFWHRLINLLEAMGEFATRPIIDRLILGPSVARLTGKQDFSFAQLYAGSEMSMVDTFYHLGLPMPGQKTGDF